MCTASWFPFAEKAVFCFSTALAASLVVLGAPYALLGLLLLGLGRRSTWTLVTAADATNPLRSWPRVLALMIAGLLASRAGLIERIAAGPAPAGLRVSS